MTPRRIAFIGTYSPQQCGIATFTAALCDALLNSYKASDCIVLAIGDGYKITYPSRVEFQIKKDELVSYSQAANFLVEKNVDLVCLQHEYGIFGGPAGSYILTLLRKVPQPVVTTLHTILHAPNSLQYQLLEEVAKLSERLIVMTYRGANLLQNVYKVPKQKIDIIPHGVPDKQADFMVSDISQGLEDKLILLSCGLLSPNKGIENVLRALPKVLAQYPEVVYVVVGATHPNILKAEGEAYREGLYILARQLGIEHHTFFINKYVEEDELMAWMRAADIFVAPYRSREQIVSGTLALALGSGKAWVSTPTWYAEELSKSGSGILVPFDSPESLTECIIELVKDPIRRQHLSDLAVQTANGARWANVAFLYQRAFEQATIAVNSKPTPIVQANAITKLAEVSWDLPEINLGHLERMTDDTGLLQHAIYSVPNRKEGYCTDDNTRALIVSVLMQENGSLPAIETQLNADKYLAFLCHAYNPNTNRMRNFLSYERQWMEEIGSECAHGRTIWALGTFLARSSSLRLRSVAAHLILLTLSAILELNDPRSIAYALLGIYEYLKGYSEDSEVRRVQDILGQRLLQCYQTFSSRDWPWFESELTYFNARLPHALLVTGVSMARSEMICAAYDSLDWLIRIQYENGIFSPIGNKGFYPRHGKMARFDQQPIEAHAVVSACVDAFRSSRDSHWKNEAYRTFTWYLGHNLLGLPLYDARTGGCRDGLQPDGVNQNQGAESTVTFILSLLDMMAISNGFS